LPTVLTIGPYRFFFFASDHDEPFHVHVEREDKTAKFWLNPVRLQYNAGFPRVEITRLQKIVTERQVYLIEAWNAYFSD